jgi:hypothetical protein
VANEEQDYSKDTTLQQMENDSDMPYLTSSVRSYNVADNMEEINDIECENALEMGGGKED